MSNKILLLEDDLLLGESLVDLLEEAEFEVVHVTNGQSALDATFHKKFAIYIFDINVPLIDGVTLLKELREADDETPTVFLTSHKEKEMLERGFLSGGDDYITKPFDSDELLLRVNALYKRVSKTKSKCIQELCHDETHKSFFYKGQELDLSKKEYDLLLLLTLHVNSIVPKELIMEELWSSAQSSSDGAVRVYINRLKQLLPQIEIKNIRGVGYKLVS